MSNEKSIYGAWLNTILLSRKNYLLVAVLLFVGLVFLDLVQEEKVTLVALMMFFMAISFYKEVVAMIVNMQQLNKAHVFFIVYNDLCCLLKSFYRRYCS